MRLLLSLSCEEMFEARTVREVWPAVAFFEKLSTSSSTRPNLIDHHTPHSLAHFSFGGI